jgi:formylglycine-generating enzyme
MTRVFCLAFVATATTLVSFSGCRRQPVDPPTAQVAGKSVEDPSKMSVSGPSKLRVTAPPKPPVTDPPKPLVTHPPKDFTNSIGMKFAWIPPGTFMMGSPDGEKERERSETQHKVTLTKGFYMGVYTVTQEQWKEVIGYTPSRFTGAMNLPVESVSWDECQEFVKKLREKDKKLYRLPTESEWEYACRAGTESPFFFGETISADQANYNSNYTYGDGKKGKYREKTMPVGSFPANAWGLCDTHGNVLQWCQDWYGAYPQQDVVDPHGPEQGEFRVLRGGSWLDDPLCCRSAHRSRHLPGTHSFLVGFRVCFFVE